MSHPHANDIRAAAHRAANRPTPARLLQAMRDPGLEMIVEAARALPGCRAAHRRANLIADQGQRVQWAKAYLAFIDEMRLYASDEELLAFIEKLAEAGRQRVYVGNGVPTETLGEVLAMEGVAEADANRDTAKLIDEPKSPGRLKALFNSLTFHQARIDRARRVLAREMVKSA